VIWNNKRRIYGILILAFLAGSVSVSYSQFAGSLSAGGYHASNVEGRDTATPDNAFTPSINLFYNLDISAPASLRFAAIVQPSFYEEVSSRSYLKTILGIAGGFYLSDIEEKAVPVSKPPIIQSQQKQSDDLKRTKPNPIQTPNMVIKDVGKSASEKLETLSELIDSFDVAKKGLSKIDAETSVRLKDSVSETVFALSEILSSEIYTESVADVVLSELKEQKRIFTHVTMTSSQKKEILSKFENIVDLLQDSKPAEDLVIIVPPKESSESPSPSGSSKADLLRQVFEDFQNSTSENAPLISLVNSQTEFQEFNSGDIAVRDDLFPLTNKTLATLLNVPITLELQNNQDVYTVYSYRIFGFKPRIDMYLGKSASLGLAYKLTNTTFPNDTGNFNDGTENLLRADSRFEFFPQTVLALEAGLSSREYDHPLEFSVRGRKALLKTDANYSHYFFGGGLVFFPIEKLSISAITHFTRSSKLRPYLSDLIRTNSILGGNANVDEYSYDLTKVSLSLASRIFWDINLSADFAYESRQYTNVQLPKKIKDVLDQPTEDRLDHGPQFGFDLSKEFLFDTRLISIFNSFTPSLDIQKVNFTSNAAQFSYEDVTIYLSFDLGF
jgi:hypothetical protein